MKVFLEGGGDHNKPLQTACRKAFTTFVTRAGLCNRPRFVACGGRGEAYDSFCTALSNPNETYAPILLIDSESAVVTATKWDHLRQRTGDGWACPADAGENDVFLMVQCMETWFLADRTALSDYFGQGFNAGSLPGNQQIEAIQKNQVFSSLNNATCACGRKGAYSKGDHSFPILERVDPSLVAQASPHAKAFLDELRVRLDN